MARGTVPRVKSVCFFLEGGYPSIYEREREREREREHNPCQAVSFSVRPHFFIPMLISCSLFTTVAYSITLPLPCQLPPQKIFFTFLLLSSLF